MKSFYLEEIRKRIEDARQLQAEMAEYKDWLGGEALDCQINFRISKADLTKFKSLARARKLKYQTYLREMIRREIRGQDDREGGGEPRLAARSRKPR